MVRPAAFASNTETAASNAFQHTPPSRAASQTALDALREFDAAAAALARAGVHVVVAEDTAEPHKPDALFPNNWVSFHADGTLVLYPMMAPSRRLERREQVLDEVSRAGVFRTTRIVDLTDHERQHRYLEGTGSLVLDHRNKVAYACLSPRTSLMVLADFAQHLGFEPVAFEAAANEIPIYHTNVMMSIGTSWVVCCGESIMSLAQRRAVELRLERSDREIIEISPAQMHAFAANVLELGSKQGAVIAMSETAHGALSKGQLRTLERYARLVVVSIPTIEYYGGGGVRCMLAEIPMA